MPELPEVERIVHEIRRFAVGNSIATIHVIRGPRYFWGSMEPVDFDPPIQVRDVCRIGKHMVFDIGAAHGGYIIAHNAMTGYFDWQHDPWTFDYVEGARKSTVSDVRVLIDFTGGHMLRFHDLRLFGRMSFSATLPAVGPELMITPCMMSYWPVISLHQFATGILSDSRPLKEVLMDQSFLAGIGNIYANEGCHVAGLHPATPGYLVNPTQVPILLEALRCVVECSMPEVDYNHLRVYRRAGCGTCGYPAIRSIVAKRATFVCERCQGVETQHQH